MLHSFRLVADARAPHVLARSMSLAASAVMLACALVSAPASAQDSLNVHVLAHIDNGSNFNDVWGYSAPDGTELAVVGTITGTQFYDVTDPSAPVEAGFVTGGQSPWRDLKTWSHYCYQVNETSGGLQIIDLSDPLQPTLVGSHSDEFDTAHNLFIDVPAGRAYVCGTDNGRPTQRGILIFDLAADPENPPLLGIYSRRYIHDLYVQDDMAYAAAIEDNRAVIIDVSDPDFTVERADWTYPGAVTHNAWTNADASIMATTDEVLGGHLRLWDITNVGRPPNLLSEYTADPLATIHNAFIIGDVCYMSYYAAGLRIVSIADPRSPVELGFYRPPNAGFGIFRGFWGAYPFGPDPRIVYCTDINLGLFILEFEGELTPVESTSWGAIKAHFR